jgi:hypothetical protein
VIQDKKIESTALGNPIFLKLFSHLSLTLLNLCALQNQLQSEEIVETPSRNGTLQVMKKRLFC